jgi:5-hydroxyisourate hydrolase
MSAITTHVLDTSRGKPGVGIKATLEFLAGNNGWQTLGQGATNTDGRISDLLSDAHKLSVGVYKLTFETQAYFDTQKVQAFYPNVQITFRIVEVDQHYHVPLLLNPFGYSTYRGS